MKLSVSVTKGDGNIKHNKRAHANTPDNIDSKRSHLNVVLVDRDIREFYQQEFGSAVDQYNSKQKRADRQIDDYYTKIVHDKKTKLFQELVVQVGNKEEQADSIELTNQIYSNFLDDFQSKYPQLKVIGAYIHNDETTPHMHIDYVPVATYSKGLSKRVANNRALKQMGFTEWDEWHTNTMDLVTEKLNELGIERDFKDNHNKHLNIAEYKELADKKKELQQEVADLEQQIVDSPLHEVINDKSVETALNEFKDFIENEQVKFPKSPTYHVLDEQEFDEKFKKHLGRDSYTIDGDDYRQIKRSYLEQTEINYKHHRIEWFEHRLDELKEVYTKIVKLVNDIKRSPVQFLIDKFSCERVDELEADNAKLKAQNEALETENKVLQKQNKTLKQELHPEPTYEQLLKEDALYKRELLDPYEDKGFER